MKKVFNSLTDLQMIAFCHCYAFYCLLIRDVSVWAIGISIAFWLIINLLIFGAKKQEECTAGLKFVSLYLALKWILFREAAPDSLCDYLLANFFVCGLYICTFGLKKIIVNKQLKSKKQI